jgi:hypothetical protein
MSRLHVCAFQHCHSWTTQNLPPSAAVQVCPETASIKLWKSLRVESYETKATEKAIGGKNHATVSGERSAGSKDRRAALVVGSVSSSVEYVARCHVTVGENCRLEATRVVGGGSGCSSSSISADEGFNNVLQPNETRTAMATGFMVDRYPYLCGF